MVMTMRILLTIMDQLRRPPPPLLLRPQHQAVPARAPQHPPGLPGALRPPRLGRRPLRPRGRVRHRLLRRSPRRCHKHEPRCRCRRRQAVVLSRREAQAQLVGGRQDACFPGCWAGVMELMECNGMNGRMEGMKDYLGIRSLVRALLRLMRYG